MPNSLLKKQVAREEKDNIEKASNKDKIAKYGFDEDEIKVMDEGNDELEQYAVLLMPFYEKNPGLPAFYEQLMKTKDRQLLYNMFILLLRTTSLFTTRCLIIMQSWISTGLNFMMT
jgi:hypothetical protein